MYVRLVHFELLLTERCVCVCVCLRRPASVRGDGPGPDAGLRVRPALQTKALAQAEPEGPGAVRPHAAVAQRPAQRGQAAGHEEDGEERCVCARCVSVGAMNMYIYTRHLLHVCPSWERDPSSVALLNVSSIFPH